MPADREAVAQARHLEALTGLRFVAALWVLVYHAMPRAGLPAPVAALAATGFLGVGVFFVLSGFILGYVYGEAGRSGSLARRPFWRARFARIYPAYAAALLFSLPLFLRDARAADGLTDVAFAGVMASTVTLMQAWIPGWGAWWNTPGWSLSVEAFFYLLFPVVIPWLMRRSSREAALLAVACVGLTAAAGLLLESTVRASLAPWLRTAAGWLTGWTPLVRLPEFALGLCLARLFAAGVRLPPWGPWLAIAALVGVAIGAGDAPEGLTHVAAVAACSAVFILGRASRPAPGFLGSPLLVRLGNASYSLYLFHGTSHAYFLALANRTLGVAWAQGWTAFVVYTVGTVGLALTVHDWIELPARRFLRGAARRGTPAASW